MKKKLLTILMILITIAGIIILLRAPILGSNSTHAYLFKYDSSVDTGRFNMILQNFIDCYKYLGAILMILSGMMLIKLHTI